LISFAQRKFADGDVTPPYREGRILHFPASALHFLSTDVFGMGARCITARRSGVIIGDPNSAATNSGTDLQRQHFVKLDGG
jgi:hypothetical protein